MDIEFAGDSAEAPFYEREDIARSIWYYPEKNRLVLYGMGVVENGGDWCFSSETALLEFGFVLVCGY